MILAIGSAADATFVHTLGAFRACGLAFTAIDFAQIVLLGELDLQPSDPIRATITVRAKRYNVEGYAAAFIRLFDIAQEAPTPMLRDRASGLYYALSQLFTAVPIRVVNPPLAGRSNFSKGYHVASLGKRVGWLVPRTLVTNSPEMASEFVAGCPMGAIFKGASAMKTWTTLYEPETHQERLACLHDCPTLFQERIVGPDVRVHVVGGQHFAELVDSPQVDYRNCRDNEYSAVDLPRKIVRGCLDLETLLGAPFLGIDFKIERSTGAWYFLEANSMPSYHGYDRRAGGAISRALSDYLS